MRPTSRLALLFALALAASRCGTAPPLSAPPPSPPPARSIAEVNAIAESYVKLVLALGRHDADFVDAYYGPPEWKAEAERANRGVAVIAGEAGTLLERLAKIPEPSEELLRLRHRYLVRQLSALRARAQMLQGKKLTFDEESLALYDAVAPTNTEEHFRALREKLAGLLPGAGPLGGRYEAFRAGFVIPPEKLDAVFSAAIEAARARTKAHIALPEGERFRVEKVTGKSWSGYNWYQGGFQSLIQVNTDLPIFIDRAVDLACHEGYPGHHVYNVLLEKNLVRDRGWIEFTVYPLFSPQSLIAEGSANFGIEVVFPGPERIRFEREVLFPIAGLDPSRAARYADVQKLAEGLAYAGNEAARRYLNGEIDAKSAADWLEEYGLMARPRAEQRVRFIDQYRSYVINYNLGRDLVRGWIESRGGTADHPEKRWEEFARLLSSPRLPSDVK
ncbi:MAG: hypothetical protein M3R62_02255 [Acidobacteriota bacterium]|nr:hypothetical protein [Acidobacteriota bacterium]